MVQLQWKFSSTGKFKIYIFSRIFTNPAWQLDSTDIVTLAVVCTAFADQDRISVFQRVQCSCAVDDGFQIPLISCKRMEKEVSGISEGVSLSTSLNA